MDHSEDAFYSDGLTVSHMPGKFIFDFVQSVPRFDNLPDGRRHTVVAKHRTILMEPVMARKIVEILQENIKKYEKTVGKINKKKVKTNTADSTRYIG